MNNKPATGWARALAAAVVAGAVIWAGGTGLRPAPALAHTSISPATKMIYRRNCKKCHGMDGKGNTPMKHMVDIPNLTSASLQAKMTDSGIVKVILDGKKDPKSFRRHHMKGYRGKITPAQAKALVKVVRAFGHAPGPFPGEK